MTNEHYKDKAGQLIDWLCGENVRFPYRLQNSPSVEMPVEYKSNAQWEKEGIDEAVNEITDL